MGDLAQWQVLNQRYLAVALQCLRLRLLRYLQQEQRVTQASAAGASQDKVDDRQLAEATAALAEAAAIDPPPALLLLGQRFDLSPFEQDLLLLCAGMELDLGLVNLCARAQQALNQPHPYPSFGLALGLFDDPAWDVLSPERPLRYWQLIEINQPGAQPLLTSAIRIDERIANYLKGFNHLDDRLEPLLVPFEATPADAALSPSQQELAAGITDRILSAIASHQPPVIQLLGTDGLSQQLVAMQVAAELGVRLYRLPVDLLPTHAAELETIARLWQRESLLLPVALYLDAQDTAGLPKAEGQAPPLPRLLARSRGLCFLATRELQPHLGRSTLAFETAKPTASEQQTTWAELVGTAAPQSPARLAGQFDLNLPQIAQIAQTVMQDAPAEADTLAQSLWEACLIQSRPRLDTLAQRLDPKATWEDLVLPDRELHLLRQLSQQVQQRSQVYEAWGFGRRMNRGMGISALFAGDSGTGKTMAAEVIANELRLNLYRIDLSAVVSKYIGETEKNLRRLFDAAEAGGAILFFDEADALFGRRSEVKDSHDRYANIEINYLLQRMEAYGGLAILATNFKSALDRAFMRRLRFIVNFPFPGVAERQQIWQRVFPPELPLADLDYDRLARFNLTGGSVHNIALNAAFLAAKAETPVTMPLVLDAIRTELEKIDRPINEMDFWVEASPAQSNGSALAEPQLK
jgi:hypothetical protein